jgi:Phosphatidate cytidylyltransferase, mitochondrial
MSVAEDSNKVSRIVTGSEARLREMYSPSSLAREFTGAALQLDDASGDRMTRCTSPGAEQSLVGQLPSVRTSVRRRTSSLSCMGMPSRAD